MKVLDRFRTFGVERQVLVAVRAFKHLTALDLLDQLLQEPLGGRLTAAGAAGKSSRLPTGRTRPLGLEPQNLGDHDEESTDLTKSLLLGSKSGLLTSASATPSTSPSSCTSTRETPAGGAAEEESGPGVDWRDPRGEPEDGGRSEGLGAGSSC